MIRLPITRLRDGMVTAQSIYNSEGASYLTRGTKLSQQYIDRLLIKSLINKAWSLAYSMYQVGRDNLTPLTKDEFCKKMEE